MKFIGKVLHFIGEITTNSVDEFILRIKRTETDAGDDPLTIVFSSTGGGIVAGLYLYDFLRLQPRHLTMVATASVSSAGIYPFLAGDVRVALPGTSFLVHSATRNLSGDFNLVSLKEEVMIMESEAKRCRDLVTSRTSLTASRWDKMTRVSHILSVDEALRYKVLHGTAKFTDHKIKAN